MTDNRRPDCLSVRPLSSIAGPGSWGWRTWKRWVVVDGHGYRSYSRRQGPDTIAFDGELYWSGIYTGLAHVQNERE